ncbi:hypothetical protein GDO86_014858 [Hymenochirus boettgeri]|uniref:snRNA-activating protein complex subunit 4 n=1 Tax=Hymenochirus boettgeri TaxID=247094 RepID=A0A8T2JT62_9PIPI|nr:hypothetical protein GDO86_014858 [Hymenochirus boettgeri]
MTAIDISAEREKIQREIESLERSLGTDIASIEVEVSDSCIGSDDDDSEIDEDLSNADFQAEEVYWDNENQSEMCLQMNMLYQSVIDEKIQEVELLIAQNKEQQDELMWEISGRKCHKAGEAKMNPLNFYIGRYMKPYFKDKITGLGPPTNVDMQDRASLGIKAYEEFACRNLKSDDYEELKRAVYSDSLQRMLQPKLLKVEYLQQKMAKTEDEVQKKIISKQICEAEKEIEDINQLPEEAIFGKRTDERDWDKISNIHFSGELTADRVRQIWQNKGHPGINKGEWTKEEFLKLSEIAERYDYLNWEAIAQELGTKRTAFQCLQKYQSCNQNIKRKEFTKEEDEMLTQLVQRMRVGHHIPYRKISYFMEGRDSMQILTRWSKSIDPAVKKGPWTEAEDELLLKAVSKYNEKQWYKIQEMVPGRTDVQCRERYVKGLHADLKKGHWSTEEKQKLLLLTQKYGLGHWTKVAKELTHRSGSQCLSKYKSLMGYFKRIPMKRTTFNVNKKTKKENESDTSSGSSSSDEDDLKLDESTDEEVVPKPTVYLIPDLDTWIPRRQILTDSGKTLMNLSTSCASLTKPSTSKKSGSGKVRTFQFNTILKGIAYPHSTDHVTENPQKMLRELVDMGRQILKIEEDDVKKILIRNSESVNQRMLQRYSEKHSKTSDGNPASSDQPEQEAENPTGTKKQHKLRKVDLYRNSADRKLLLAVIPWVGNVFLPISTNFGRPWKKGSHADLIRQKLHSVPVTSTPFFTFLIQFFQIDADGCLRMIRTRKVKLPPLFQIDQENAAKKAKLPPLDPSKKLPIPPLPPAKSNRWKNHVTPPKPKTVSELLREKRMRESMAKKAVGNAIVLSPNVMLPQPLMINAQPGASVKQKTVVLPVAPSTPEKGVWSIMPFISLPAGQIMPNTNVINPVPSSHQKSSNEAVVDPGKVTSSPAPSSQPQSPLTLMPTALGSAVNSNNLPITWVVTPKGLVPLPVQALGGQVQAPTANSNFVLKPGGSGPAPASSGSNATNSSCSGPIGHVQTPPGVTLLGTIPVVQNSGLLDPTKTFPSSAIAPQLTTQGSSSNILSPKKYPIVKVTKLLPTGPPGQDVINTTPVPGPLSPSSIPQSTTPNQDKKAVDLSLVSLDGDAVDWFQGNEGVKIPNLKKSMPFLPPSICTINTLSCLLLQKSNLEEKAFKLIPAQTEGEKESNNREKARMLREMVQEKLKDNTAYLLLKQRFLSAFAIPGFLSILPPGRMKTTMNMLSIDEDSDDEISEPEYNEFGRGNLETLREGPAPSASEQGSVAEMTNIQMSTEDTNPYMCLRRATRKRVYNDS